MMEYGGEPVVEPWLRGTRGESDAVTRAVLHALDQAEEDVLRWTAGLSDEEMEARPFNLPSVGWQVRHVVRSLDRLLTYAEGNGLNEAQMDALRSEASDMGGLEGFRSAMERVRARVIALGGDLEEERFVGRERLKVSLGALLVHLAEHTQRHVGQLITTAKVLGRASHD